MKYVIRKVPERDTVYLERLIPGALIYNDVEHRGAVESFVEAIKIANDDALYVQDDMLLCHDFCARAESYIAQHSDTVIVFSTTSRISEAGIYPASKGRFLLCTYIPRAIGKAFVEWYESREYESLRLPWSYYYDQQDDAFFYCFLEQVKENVYVAIPNLAGHPKNTSVINPNRPVRTCPYFDYEKAAK